jgi:hypothetical protein
LGRLMNSWSSSHSSPLMPLQTTNFSFPSLPPIFL